MDIFLTTLFIVICVLLILVVLLQKGRGGGLGAALGGMGSSAFGTRVGDVFTWVTIVLTAMFLLVAIGATMWFRPPVRQAIPPQFRPMPNPRDPITTETYVEIMAADKTDQVFYTTDGSEPTGDSEQYELNPVKIRPGMTLKAVAHPSRGKPSTVVTATYGVKAPSPPEPTTRPSTGPARPPATAPATAPATRPAKP